ncbi:unnamed protein product [Cylindrotheca closterium]|uniref:Uncharacterized protein n=1 Tax=Cylindrotheca closterium TaxID=2856 RepID=A0AAD2G1A0_9STRA|nr:unnamed protein product [Cylindrotheca closterium]
MTRSLQILTCAVGFASVLSFPVTSITSTLKITLTEEASLPFPRTVLFSAHKSRSRSAYSGTKVGDNGPPEKYQQYQQAQYEQQQQQFQQFQQQQFQQLPQPQPQPQYQQQSQSQYHPVGFSNHQSTTSSMPDQLLPVAPDGSELPEKVGSVSYSENSQPWFEDPRGGIKQVSYAAPVNLQPVNLTPPNNQVNQGYSPYVPAGYAPPTNTNTVETGTRTTTNNPQTVPLPTQDFPRPVDMAPPLAVIPPPFPAFFPEPPPPMEEPFTQVARANGLLTEQPTKAVIHGGSRRTWRSDDPTAQTSAVWVQAERPGGPLYANVHFRNGPSSTPQSMKVYSEDGYLRPLQAYFGRPRGVNRAISQTIDVINTADMSFPISATISQSSDFGTYGNSFQGEMSWKNIQGNNAIRTYAQDPNTEFVRVNLETDGLPMECNIEVLQGPGDVRQVIELRSDDGSPWEGIVAVPGNGASVIVRNVGPLEFPIRASVENHGFD